MSKQWYTSKTLWGAVLYAAIALAKYFGVEGAESGQLDPLMERLGAAVGMVLLRKATNQPMHFFSPE